MYNLKNIIILFITSILLSACSEELSTFNLLDTDIFTLDLISDQTVVENQSITAINAGVIGSDVDSEGNPITYTCYYDNVDDDFVANDIACSTIVNISIDLNTGEVSWTPSYTQAGTYELKITGQADGESDFKILTITVLDVDQSPLTYARVLNIESTQMKVIWSGVTSGSNSTVNISYSESGNPITCNSPDFVVDSSLGEKIITGLSAFTTYDFQICPSSSGEVSLTLDNIDFTEKTYPSCDYTLNDLDLDTTGNSDSTDSFSEFQTFLDGTSNLDDSDGASTIAICLNGVHILNSNTIADTRIEIPSGIIDFFIYGVGTIQSIIENQRTNQTQLGHTTMYVNTVTASFANLMLISNGGDGIILDASTNANIPIVENMILESYGDGLAGNKTGIFLFTNSEIGLIRDVTVLGHGLKFGGVVLSAQTSTSVINEIVRLTVIGDTGTTNAYGIAFVLKGGRIGSVLDSTITLDGDLSFGIILNENGVIDKLQNITLKRSSAAIGYATAIAISDDSYFSDVSLVTNNIICTESAITTWDSLLYDLTGTAEYTSVTNPYVVTTVLGAQTFSWGDASDVGNIPYNTQSQWGGTCQ